MTDTQAMTERMRKLLQAGCPECGRGYDRRVTDSTGPLVMICQGCSTARYLEGSTHR